MAQEAFIKFKNVRCKSRTFNLIRKYFHVRYQKVALKGQISSWYLIKSEVPEGSVLGPLFFNIH